MKNILSQPKFLRGVKILSVMSALYLIAKEVINQIKRPLFLNSLLDFNSLRELIGNSSIVILFIILSFKPQKIGILAICSFYYAITCNFFDSNNPMGICMYFLGICILYLRGQFFVRTKQRIIELTVLYLIILFSDLHLGIKFFIQGISLKLAYSLVLGMNDFFFITTLEYNRVSKTDNSKILNLANYPCLVKNDVALLQEVLNKKQYKEIALDSHRAEGTVRNRLNKIYDILGVMDRMGFISTYMGYEIVFQKNESSCENKSEDLNSLPNN